MFLAVKSPALAVMATPTLENILSSMIAGPVELIPIAELFIEPLPIVMVPLFNIASLSIASVLN